MHELGMTRSIVAIVTEHSGGQKVVRVTVELGRLCGFAPEAMRFCFDIENVGNLVCLALFDLGEAARVVIFSITEGEDKPMKYPHMFRAADVVVLSKTDLLPHLHVDLTQMIDNALRINPKLLVFALSAESAQGLESWYGWLRGHGEVAKSAA